MKKMSRINFVGILLRQEGKVLFLKNKSSDPEQDGIRGLPGGHLDINEKYMDCLIREIEEELKIKIDPTDCSEPLVLYAVSKKEPSIFLGWYVSCDQRTGTPQNNEPDKCSKISRYTTETLPQKVSIYAKAAIEAFDTGEHYVELEV